MATPKNVTDGSSDLDEAVLNNYVNGLISQVKVNYFMLFHDESAGTQAVGGSFDDNGEITDSDLSYNSTSDQFEITLSGFSNTPIVQATLRTNATTNVGDVLTQTSDATSSLATIRPVSGAAGSQAAVDPDGDLRIFVFIIGS